MYQLGIIFGALFLAPSMGIYGLAWGVVIGAVFYLFLQIPTLLKQKGSYTFTLGFEQPKHQTSDPVNGTTLAGRGSGATQFLGKYLAGFANVPR